jgi:hypothetical protein
MPANVCWTSHGHGVMAHGHAHARLHLQRAQKPDPHEGPQQMPRALPWDCPSAVRHLIVDCSLFKKSTMRTINLQCASRHRWPRTVMQYIHSSFMQSGVRNRVRYTDNREYSYRIRKQGNGRPCCIYERLTSGEVYRGHVLLESGKRHGLMLAS